jgi:RND family efflux transporter MFP subunit
MNQPRRSRWRRWVVGAAVVIILVVAGVATVNRTEGPSYRTTSVERADVDATLDTLGTIQPVNQANLSFPVAGHVSSVAATLGQHVTVGQILAQLDTASLDAQVASAKSAVAAAQARLAADQSSQTATTPTAAVAPAAFTTQNPPDPTAAARELVTTRQARLIADQHRADQDLATEQHDLKTQTGLCQAWVTAASRATTPAIPEPPSPSPATTATPDAPSPSPAVAATTPSPTPKPKPRSTVPRPHFEPAIPGSPDASGCAAALQTVLADQVAVSHDQQAVAADLPALNDAITRLLASARASNQPQQHTTTTGPAAGGADRATPSRPPASAEQLASDQAAIDAAQAQLVEAQQTHNQAVLRSPIDGTVGSVTISTGQSVQQGNPGTAQIVVIGPGSHQVTTSISDTAVGAVRVGDTATVTPSGSSAPLRGQVVSIGLLAADPATSSGSVSYPITIGLPGTEQQLFAGQSARVSIMLAHVSGVLTVPSSAVHHTGASTTVSVLRAGTVSTVVVTTGAAGPTRTEVLSGLNPGDQVILADLSQPLPTTSLQNIRRITAGGSGRPGG